MIMKFKNAKIEKLYKITYENLSDLCNVRDVIFNNNVNHYNFNKYFQEVNKYEFEDLYNNYSLSKQKYLLCYRTRTNKLYEFACYSLSEQDKRFNNAFLKALRTR